MFTEHNIYLLQNVKTKSQAINESLNNVTPQIEKLKKKNKESIKNNNNE
jgi:hypothetical protein